MESVHAALPELEQKTRTKTIALMCSAVMDYKRLAVFVFIALENGTFVHHETQHTVHARIQTHQLNPAESSALMFY